MNIVKCECCNQEPKIRTVRTSSVKEVRDKTGFEIVFTHQGGLYYVCPDCYKKLKYHAKELYNLFKKDDIFINGLLDE